MAFTEDKLLLTETRKAQLVAALANTGLPDPLAQCIAEAIADIARLTAGYLIDASSLDGWTRTIAIWKAFVIAELGVPEDIQKAYDSAQEELQAIAQGKRPNLPRVPDDSGGSTSTGMWGSKRRIR